MTSEKEPNKATDAMANNFRYNYLSWRNGWPGTYGCYTADWQPIHDYGPHYVHVLTALGVGALTHFCFRSRSPGVRWFMTGLTASTTYCMTYDYLRMVI